MSHRPTNVPSSRHPDNNERFVAFAFAAAELVVETEPSGQIISAAGAFRTRLGQAPETFVGRAIRDIVDPIDHATLETALQLLAEKGRLLPLMIRLADSARTPLALAGIRFATTDNPVRLYLTFAIAPSPIEIIPVATPHAFARATEARLRGGASSDVGLLELQARKTGLSIGHTVGDVLQHVAPDVLATEVAPGRFGLLGAGGSAGLIAIAGSLEAALRGKGVDVGIASHNLALPDEGLTTMQAARALRQALAVFASGGMAGLSAAGFSGGLAGYLHQAVTHTSALRRAIRDRRFDLMFQPIVSLADRSLHHYEALLRPEPIADCAFDTPQAFVMLVEALGLAEELDLAVVDLACGAGVISPVPIAFNLSAQSVQNAAFRARLLRSLSARPGRGGGQLIAEMTETAEVTDVAEAARTAQALRDIGVPFCLDDFGAGAADMRLLRALPADIVKLDGSYVSNVLHEGRERGFVAAMIDIARSVQAVVVAEQIETEAQAAVLLAMGVDYGQGWLFGRAAPLPESTVRRTAAVRPPAARRRTPSKDLWE